VHEKSIKQKKYQMPKLGYGDEIHVQKGKKNLKYNQRTEIRRQGN
jgi:hypothetical protein